MKTTAMWHSIPRLLMHASVGQYMLPDYKVVSAVVVTRYCIWESWDKAAADILPKSLLLVIAVEPHISMLHYSRAV